MDKRLVEYLENATWDKARAPPKGGAPLRRKRSLCAMRSTSSLDAHLRSPRLRPQIAPSHPRSLLLQEHLHLRIRLSPFSPLSRSRLLSLSSILSRVLPLALEQEQKEYTRWLKRVGDFVR